MLFDDSFYEFDDFLRLLVSQQIIDVRDNSIYIRHKDLHTEYDFHDIRVNNTAKVLLNEIFYFKLFLLCLIRKSESDSFD